MKLNQIRNPLAGFPAAAPASAAPPCLFPVSAVVKRRLPGLPTFRLPLLLLLLALPAAVQAQFSYTSNNGTITITGYTGPGGAVTIPSTIIGLPVTSIGDRAFENQTAVTRITIPNSVTSIEGYAFNNNSSLTNVTIPNSVTSIGVYAFYNCTSLASVTIPSSVTSIGEGALYGCTSLTEIKVDGGNSVYSGVDGVLFNKSLTTLLLCPEGKAGNYTIPSSVTAIEGFSFSGCTSLTGVTIPSSVTSIGIYAFAGCINLTSIVIPGTVTDIGHAAFYYCSALTSVTILSGVTNIESEAFNECTSLASITIPDSVTSIGQGAFLICTSMTEINVDAGNSIYRSVDGVLFNKSLTTLIQFPVGKPGSYTIPSSVASIGYQAFYVCINLASVTIGSSITSIDGSTFFGCTSLTSVTIPSSVTFIWDYVFGGCTNLNGIYFQGNAPSVGGGLSSKATVYYLPGTTGWGRYFGGRPTALWKPQVRTSDGSFGVRTNQFGFNITWASGRTVVVEASTSLAAPDWSPVATNTLTSGASYFSDPEWTNYPNRFYRLRSP